MTAHILIVDDEVTLRRSASEWLALNGFSVETAENGAVAMAKLARGGIDVVLSDVRMPGLTGMDLLREISSLDAGLPVILLTAHGDVSLAVEAMRAGAHDFLEKPYDADHLVAVLRRAVGVRRLNEEVLRLRESSGEELQSRFAGLSPTAQSVRDRISHLKDIDVDILIRGETGAGKEVVARALHDFGKRRSRPFVAINCAAVPETVFESELFGHERGAFTGASDKRIGRIEHAQGGTVFLDEIESMPLTLQVKMLRVIQERVIEPLGGNRQAPVDVRFIAASKTDLKADSDTGKFRADLYFRLSTVEILIPPLRERSSDIPLLFRHFVTQAAKRHGVDPPEPGMAQMAMLQAAKWPGNTRELKAEAERFVLGLKADSGAGGLSSSLPDRVAAFEAETIRQALAASGGNTQAAAASLSVPLRTLNEKITRYGLRS